MPYDMKQSIYNECSTPTLICSSSSGLPSIFSTISSKNSPVLPKKASKSKFGDTYDKKNTELQMLNTLAKLPFLKKHSHFIIKELQNDTNLVKRNFNSHPLRNFILNPFTTTDLLNQHTYSIYKSLYYVSQMQKNSSFKNFEENKVMLNDIPPHAKNTLVLDLDETLIYNCTNTMVAPDVVIECEIKKKETDKFGEKRTIPFKIRPFLKKFLKYVAQNFEVILFTASSKLYTKHILQYIDPGAKIFNNVITRESCTQTKNGLFIKDLRVLENRNLENILIIDNFAHSFGLQLENGFPILEWKGDDNDKELCLMIEFLKPYIKLTNIPKYNAEKLKLREVSKLDLNKLII